MSIKSRMRASGCRCLWNEGMTRCTGVKNIRVVFVIFPLVLTFVME